MSKCEVCNVKVGEGRRLWGEHVQGKKHQKNLNRSSAEKKNGDKSQGEADPADNRTTSRDSRQSEGARKEGLTSAKAPGPTGLSIVGKLMEEFQKQAEVRQKSSEGRARADRRLPRATIQTNHANKSKHVSKTQQQSSRQLRQV